MAFKILLHMQLSALMVFIERRPTKESGIQSFVAAKR
jgi:hypothetical protein